MRVRKYKPLKINQIFAQYFKLRELRPIAWLESSSIELYIIPEIADHIRDYINEKYKII